MARGWIAVMAEIEAGRSSAPSSLFWTLFAFGLVVIGGAVVLYWADRLRKRPLQVGQTPQEQLAQFQELYEQGELSQEEFDRIRARLQKKAGISEPPPVPPQANGSTTG